MIQARLRGNVLLEAPDKPPRLRRSRVVDSLGRTVRDGDVVRDGRGRMGAVATALGVPPGPWADRRSAPALGGLIVTWAAGSNGFIKARDVVKVRSAGRVTP